MISPGTAALAISVAKGLIKLGGRVDRLMAEKEAVTGEQILPMPPVSEGLDDSQKSKALKKLLRETKNQTPDPLGSDGRAEISAALKEQDELTADDVADFGRVSGLINDLFTQYLPEQALELSIRPDAEYLKKLQEFYPSINLDDTETRLAAFYIRAGERDGNISYAGRIGLLVIDVLAEFGAENTALFTRDAKVQSIVSSVLKRFSKPDLEDYIDWSPLLRHALKSTLNGMLDARESYQGDEKWVEALLDALDEARKDAERGDDYLLGLFQGKGYQRLLSKGLNGASKRLTEADAAVFKNLAGDVLKAAAPLVKANKKGFAGFFRENWGDLLNAGLKSIEKHGPELLDGQPDLLKETLFAVISELAVTNGREVFTGETLRNVVDATIAVVAAKPELITASIDEEWLRAFMTSIATTANNRKARNLFSRDGLEAIIKDAAGVFAENPELIIASEDHDVFKVVVGGILSKISGVDRISAKTIAEAAIGGALEGIADNPGLLKTRYPTLIAGFAGNLSTLVKDKSLSAIQARDIMTSATKAMIANPILFDELGEKISGTIVEAVLKNAEDSGAGLLGGAMVTQIIDRIFGVLARNGKDLVANNSTTQLKKKLIETIRAALERSKQELGNRLTVADLPETITGIVGALAKGELPNVLQDEAQFETVFNRIVAQINA